MKNFKVNDIVQIKCGCSYDRNIPTNPRKMNGKIIEDKYYNGALVCLRYKVNWKNGCTNCYNEEHLVHISTKINPNFKKYVEREMEI